MRLLEVAEQLGYEKGDSLVLNRTNSALGIGVSDVEHWIRRARWTRSIRRE